MIEKNTLTIKQCEQLRKWGFIQETHYFWVTDPPPFLMCENSHHSPFVGPKRKLPRPDLYELIMFTEKVVNEKPLKTKLDVPNPYGISFYKHREEWHAGLTAHSTVDLMKRTEANDPDIYQSIYKLLKKVIDE